MAKTNYWPLLAVALVAVVLGIAIWRSREGFATEGLKVDKPVEKPADAEWHVPFQAPGDTLNLA